LAFGARGFFSFGAAGLSPAGGAPAAVSGASAGLSEVFLAMVVNSLDRNSQKVIK
jgi:hypothetical protein